MNFPDRVNSLQKHLEFRSRWFRCIILFLTCFTACKLPLAVGQVPDSAVQISVQIGFDGHWKLGHTIPIRVDLKGLDSAENLIVTIQTLDADGVEVNYRQKIQSPLTNNSLSCWVPVRIGRIGVNLTVGVEQAGQPIAVREFTAEEYPAALPSTQPLFIAIGSTLGIESASSTYTSAGTSTFTTSLIDSADGLPDDWQLFASCDLVIFATSNVNLLQSLSDNQWHALDKWIRSGGRCVISITERTDHANVPTLKSWLPGELGPTVRINNPGPLESFVITDSTLGDFTASTLVGERGEVELSLSDNLNRRIPWLIRHAHGLGIVQTIVSDLDHPTFLQWSDKNKLWKRLISRHIDLNSSEASTKSAVSSTSYLGYDDMVGQLRATLDLFQGVQLISFGQLAAMLVLFLLLVGPLDYFVCVIWLKRPELSWYIAGLLSIVACAALISMFQSMRPDKVCVNSVQIVDIDTQSRTARGNLWSHIYSAQARQLNVSFKSDQAVALHADWQGLPGRGLGGLMSQLNTDRGMPSYEILQSNGGLAEVSRVGVPAAGTKSLHATWMQDFPIDEKSQLKELKALDQLEGTFVNSLSCDIKDAMLVYHNWCYNLPTRIPAGESVAIEADTIPKTFARRLNGRRVIDNVEQMTLWDPGDRKSLSRLLELMMFYKAAGGASYTALAHRYQPQIDLSSLIELDRAIVVGRIDEPIVSVEVTGQDVPQVEQNVREVWCRVAIPVAQHKRSELTK